MKRKGFLKCISAVLTLCMTLSCVSFALVTADAATVDAAGDTSVSAANTSSDDNFTWDNATVYFLLTDRFKNGNTSNDHSYNRGLDQNGNVVSGIDTRATFHGGDFAGITQTIEDGYFNDLGVNALWISAPYEQIHGYIVGGDGNPSFAHYSYHGYYVLDYTETDANFGTPEEFEELVDTAHEHGLRVILDIVMNHAGYNSIYDMNEYNFGTLKSGWESYYYSHQNVNNTTYHSYIDYDTSASDWGRWWGADWIRAGLAGYTNGGGDEKTMCLSGLPDFKTESTATVGIPAFLQNKWTKDGTLSQKTSELSSYLSSHGKSQTVTNTISYWLSSWVREYGVDGFRCDTAKHVDVSAWKVLKDDCKEALEQWRQENPNKPGADWDEDFWMTGEHWDHNIGYGKDSYFTSGAFDSMINFETQGGGLFTSGTIDNTYNYYASSINTVDNFNQLSYISSHDSTLARGDLISTGSAFLLLPGGVQIFYGDETNRPSVSGINFDGNGGAGHSLRSDMNWDSMDKNVLAHWQKVGTFRNNHPSIGAGSNTDLSTTSGYAFAREYNKNGISDKAAGCIYANKNTSVTIDVSSLWADGQSLVNAYDQSSAVVTNGKVTFNSGANGTILIEEPDGRPLMNVAGNAEFEGTQTVTVTLEGCDTAKASIDGGNKFLVKNGSTFTIGDTAYPGDTVTVTLEGTNENGTATASYIFKKLGGSIVEDEGVTIHVKPYSSSQNLYLYTWDDDKTEYTGKWPGTALTQKDSDGNYVYTLDDVDTVNAIINNGSGGQTSDITGLSGEVLISVTNSGCTAYEVEQITNPLEELIKEAKEVKAMTSSDYTQATWNSLQTVMTTADALIAQGEDADSAQVNSTIEQLKSAKAALKLNTPALTYAVKGNSEIKGVTAPEAEVTVTVNGNTYNATADDITGEFSVTATSLTSSSVINVSASRDGISSDDYSYNMSNGDINGGVTPTQPTTEPTEKPTTQPTTAPTTEPTQATTQPTSATDLSVTATSNFFSKATETVEKGSEITVSFKLKSSMNVLNSQWTINYDPSKLELVSDVNQSIAPSLNGLIVNQTEAGTIKGNSTSMLLSDFTTSKDFVTLNFKVIGTGSADVSLDVDVLGVAYKSGNNLFEAYPVDNGIVNDITGETGFNNFTYSATSYITDTNPTTEPTTEPTQPTQPTTEPTDPTQPTTPPTDQLTVNAKSNFFTNTTKTFDKNTDTVTVYYKLSSSKAMDRTHWTLTYDTSKLTLLNADMACVSNEKITNPREGAINCLYTNSDPVTFSSEKSFVIVKFAVKGTGEAVVNLNVNAFAINSDNTSSAETVYLVQNGVVNDVTSIAGFEDTEYSTRVAFASTQSTTPPVEDDITVNAKSNFFTTASTTVDKDTDTVTVYYKLKSSKEMAKSHWTMIYDTSKLTLINADMACVSGEKITNPREGAINCLYTNSDPVTFSSEKTFVVAKFKIKGTGQANVSLTVNSLAINSDNTSSADTTYLVQNGVVNDVTSIAGFEDTEYSTRIAFASSK